MKRRPNGYWTYDRCKEESLKYKTLTVFRKEKSGALNTIRRNKWNELIQHLMSDRKPDGFWSNYDNCKKTSISCNSITELQRKYNGAYLSIHNNNWLELYSHMEERGTYIKRLIYVYIFHKTKHIYVGLTCNLSNRDKAHRCKGSVFNCSLLSGEEIPNPIIEIDFISSTEAIIKEGEVLKKYLNNGYISINKAKTGGLGGNIFIWTYDKCKEETLKYNSITKYQRGSSGSYKACIKNGWLDELCGHMKRLKVTNGFFSNKENCINEIKKYKYITDFINKSRNAYDNSIKNGWYEEIKEYLNTP